MVRQKEFSLVFVRLQVLIYDRYTIGGGAQAGWARLLLRIHTGNTQVIPKQQTGKFHSRCQSNFFSV